MVLAEGAVICSWGVDENGTLTSGLGVGAVIGWSWLVPKLLTRVAAVLKLMWGRAASCDRDIEVVVLGGAGGFTSSMAGAGVEVMVEDKGRDGGGGRFKLSSSSSSFTSTSWILIEVGLGLRSSGTTRPDKRA